MVGKSSNFIISLYEYALLRAKSATQSRTGQRRGQATIRRLVTNDAHRMDAGHLHESQSRFKWQTSISFRYTYL